MKYTFELGESSFYMPRLTRKFRLVELVFEDMASFGEAIFKEAIENVVTGKSKYIEITGNMCSLEISKDYTLISTEFVKDCTDHELRVDTVKLFKLVEEWTEMNSL